MAIDPKGADLKRCLGEEGGPVVLLNLLRFRDGAEYQARERRLRRMLRAGRSP